MAFLNSSRSCHEHFYKKQIVLTYFPDLFILTSCSEKYIQKAVLKHWSVWSSREKSFLSSITLHFIRTICPKNIFKNQSWKTTVLNNSSVETVLRNHSNRFVRQSPLNKSVWNMWITQSGWFLNCFEICLYSISADLTAAWRIRIICIKNRIQAKKESVPGK